MKPAAVFVWSNFGPYHVDRLVAATSALADTHRVIGIEMAGSSSTYAWDRSPDSPAFERITLFPDGTYEKMPLWSRLAALVRVCYRLRPRHVFLCHYDRAETFLLAVLLRIVGCRVYLMIESKFDDKPRQIWREVLKAAFYLPYARALVGGPRSADYLRLYGFQASRIELGYDTISIERVRRLAGSPPAPLGVPFAERHFTIVARLVPKKNLSMALDAYAQYCRLAGSQARALDICGSGTLEDELRAKAQQLGLSRVVFRGFVQATEVARTLASSLALILPSTEEQWGLVVNEAVAMGLPILCSHNVGARDLLVKTAINGFTFEPDNPTGLARLMLRLGENEREWRTLAEGSLKLAPLADVDNFAVGVARLIGVGTMGTLTLDRPSVGAPP